MLTPKNTAHRKKQLLIRAKLWPKLDEDDLWLRKSKTKGYSAGFITIPRPMPLLLSIMDDMSNGHPPSSTYLDLFCRSFDECYVVLNKQPEMAFHSGFTGQRALRTWRDRMELLHELGFIDIKAGPSGPLSYALIYNPYLVVKKHHDQKHPGIRDDKYTALCVRAIEIGAEDLGAEDLDDPA